MAVVYVVMHSVAYEGEGLVSVHDSQIGAALAAQVYAEKNCRNYTLEIDWTPAGPEWSWLDSTVRIDEVEVQQ